MKSGVNFLSTHIGGCCNNSTMKCRIDIKRVLGVFVAIVAFENQCAKLAHVLHK